MLISVHFDQPGAIEAGVPHLSRNVVSDLCHSPCRENLLLCGRCVAKEECGNSFFAESARSEKQMAAVSRENGNLAPCLARKARIVVVLDHAPDFKNSQPGLRIGCLGPFQVLCEGIDGV